MANDASAGVDSGSTIVRKICEVLGAVDPGRLHQVAAAAGR